METLGSFHFLFELQKGCSWGPEACFAFFQPLWTLDSEVTSAQGKISFYYVFSHYPQQSLSSPYGTSVAHTVRGTYWLVTESAGSSECPRAETMTSYHKEACREQQSIPALTGWCTRGMSSWMGIPLPGPFCPDDLPHQLVSPACLSHPALDKVSQDACFFYLWQPDPGRCSDPRRLVSVVSWSLLIGP